MSGRRRPEMPVGKPSRRWSPFSLRPRTFESGDRGARGLGRAYASAQTYRAVGLLFGLRGRGTRIVAIAQEAHPHLLAWPWG